LSENITNLAIDPSKLLIYSRVTFRASKTWQLFHHVTYTDIKRSL